MKDLLDSEKRKVRFEFLNLRDKLDPILAAAYSNVITAAVRKLPLYEKAKTIMFYMSYGSEVITDAMIAQAFDDGKTVVVPAIENPGDGAMIAVRISRLEDAFQYVYGIRQPEIMPDESVSKEDIDLVFVPGIAFDYKGYRTGYGKGYFDKWLKDIPIGKTIGVAYDCQITDKVPTGKNDLPVGSIITEKRYIQVVRN
ncbi:MAG: 5-formyltetrahydrofolate cyclo-ligase [Endomicrobium sp.]|nr:5-formyltetrahydrofolate cyclo-ligase [Endomicrobium sp.]